MTCSPGSKPLKLPHNTEDSRTADGDLAAISLLATLVEDEYPLTARHTIKRAFRDDYCLLLTVRVANPDSRFLTVRILLGATALKDEFYAEPTVSHLWINLANLGRDNACHSGRRWQSSRVSLGRYSVHPPAPGP